MRTPLLAAAALSIVSFAFSARAETSPEAMAARRDLIQQAQAKREAGDHAAALDLASRAGKIQMSVSLRRFLAEEHKALGSVAQGLGTAEQCEREAHAAGPDADVHAEACHKLVEELRPLVGYVVLRPVQKPDGLTIGVAGSDVPAPLWETRYPVTPGAVAVEAKAPAHKPYSSKVEVVRGAIVDVPIKLTPEPIAQTPSGIGPEAPPPATKWKMSPLLPIGAGAAVVGFAVAGTLAIVSNGKLSDYKSRCVVAGAPASCAGDQTSLQSTLDGNAIFIDVGLAVGIAGLVVGGVGLYMSGDRPVSTSTASASPTLRF